MEKTIRKWGGSLGLLFSAEEVKRYNLEEDDIVDISDMIVKKKVKKDEKKS